MNGLNSLVFLITNLFFLNNSKISLFEFNFKIGTYMWSKIASEYFIGKARVDLNKMTINLNEKDNKINSSEKKVLIEMLSNPGKTFSREEIGIISGITQERSIDVMITRLRQKLEANSKNPKYLQTIRGLGYVLWVE